MTMIPAKTVQPVEMPFETLTRVGPRNHVLDGVAHLHHCITCQIRLNCLCLAIIWTVATITEATCFHWNSCSVFLCWCLSVKIVHFTDDFSLYKIVFSHADLCKFSHIATAAELLMLTVTFGVET